jgi:DNA-binding IclR family transcriptional regulator
VQSLDRLVTILETIAHDGPSLSAAEVAQTTGLSLSTVSRLMIQLAEAGLLHRSEPSRRYVLGPRLYALARAADDQIDVTVVARPLLEQLRDETGETCSMHVLRGDQRICTIEVPSMHSVRRVVPVGLAEPVVGSATGAVLLAARGAEERRAVLDRLDVRGSERRQFEAVVAHAEQTGWALVTDDWVAGLTGLSVEVPEGDGSVAAISISGPSHRFTQDFASAHLERALDVAAEISTRVGGAPRRRGALPTA